MIFKSFETPEVGCYCTGILASQNSQPVVNGSSVAAAGLASAAAALVTSRFGVAGTLIGAALTTMIITGGSAILKSYLEGVTGRVRKVPGKVRAKAGRMRSPQDGGPREIPSRPDLRNNFMGRLRAAFDWFLHLSPLRRRAILAGAIVPAVIAFLISMGAVTALEVAIGKSLPCGIWNNCPVAADGSLIKNTGPSITGARVKTQSVQQDRQVPGVQQQTPGVQQNGQQGVDPNAQPDVDPGVQPATPDPVVPDPATPDSGTPDSGTPGAGDQPVDPATPATPVPAPSDQAAPPAQGTPAPSE